MAIGIGGGVDAVVLRGGKEARYQLLVGQLVTEYVFYARQAAADHGRCIGGAAAQAILSIQLILGAGDCGERVCGAVCIGDKYTFPRCGNTEGLGDPAAIEEG